MTKNEYMALSSALNNIKNDIIRSFEEANRRMRDMQLMSEDHTEEARDAESRLSEYEAVRAEAMREADANYHDDF